jgi:hypothetical protein
MRRALLVFIAMTVSAIAGYMVQPPAPAALPVVTTVQSPSSEPIDALRRLALVFGRMPSTSATYPTGPDDWAAPWDPGAEEVFPEDAEWEAANAPEADTSIPAEEGKSALQAFRQSILAVVPGDKGFEIALMRGEGPASLHIGEEAAAGWIVTAIAPAQVSLTRGSETIALSLIEWDEPRPAPANSRSAAIEAADPPAPVGDPARRRLTRPSRASSNLEN